MKLYNTDAIISVMAYFKRVIIIIIVIIITECVMLYV